MANKITEQSVPHDDIVVEPEVGDWDYPVFTMPMELVEFHNEMAKKHTGHQVCYKQADRIKTMVAIVKQYNSSVELKLKLNVEGGHDKYGKPTPPKIDHGRVPQAIEGMVRSYGSAMTAHCREVYTLLDADINGAYNTGQATLGKPEIEAVFVKLIGIGAIELSGKKAKALDKQQSRVATSLPNTIKQALGLDQSKLFEIGYPDVLQRVQLLEAYIDRYQALISKYTELMKYEYAGPIPAPTVPDFPGSDEPPEVVPWNEETHTVEV